MLVIVNNSIIFYNLLNKYHVCISYSEDLRPNSYFSMMTSSHSVQVLVEYFVIHTPFFTREDLEEPESLQRCHGHMDVLRRCITRAWISGETTGH